jgi:hypothetical protein
MPVGLLIIFTPAHSRACNHTHYCREAVRSVHIIYSPIKPPCVFERHNKYNSTLSVSRNSEKFPDVPVPNKKTLHKYVKRFWINRFHSRQYKNMQKIYAK